MTPRRYRMRDRAEAKDETRRRIVQATLALHAQQGIMATSWEDIAKRAGISVATVYRHFPTLDQLAPACGERVLAIAKPPDASVFSGLKSAERRLERLITEVFASYERAAPWIANMYRERFLEDDLDHFIASREALIREALGASSEQAVWITVAMTDFWAWKSLANRGLSTEVSAKLVADGLVAATDMFARTSKGKPRRSSRGRS